MNALIRAFAASALLQTSACGRPIGALAEQPVEAAPRADTLGWYVRAMALEADGDLAGADLAMDWALRLDPADPGLALAHTRFLLRCGRFDEAAEAASDAVALGPGAEAELVLGQALIHAGREDEAITHLERAAGSADAEQLLVRAYLRRGDRERAMQSFDRWRVIEVGTKAAFDRGRAGLELGRAADAVDDLVAALADPAIGADVGFMLVRAARESCRIGTAWHWARQTKIELDADERWRQVGYELAALAGDRAMMARLTVGSGGVTIPTPECDPDPFIEAARADPGEGPRWLARAWDAAPLNPEVHGALRATYDGRLQGGGDVSDGQP